MAGSDREKLHCDDGGEQANFDRLFLSTPPAPIHHIPLSKPPQHQTKTTLNQDILGERPAQTELLELLAPISAQWSEIGRALHVHHNFLTELEIGPNTSTIVKLDKVIHQWLISGVQHLITWREVIAALEGAIINDKEIADKIRKYLAEHQ